MVIYVTALVLAFLSLLFWPRTLVRSAFYLLALAFVVHTVGLVSRMVLQGRPPVTNLYSSAIFVGWAAVLLGIVLERFYRNGIGTMVASAIGFVTLIIAHHLAASGDTLEMMRAVLDSNFWLATHVVCITIGYSSTFLSGFLAILYLVRRVVDRRWNETHATEMERMVYGIVCFSLLFSFIGTILGGIWADQSWGRFWGWDPKENGALMIVLWNAFILHARVGKLAGQRAVMIMAVFGNVVTAFSWFGVNMLGIGLHSYGFMEKAFVWLVIFAVSQLLVMTLGFVPDDATRRYAPRNR
jgi:cytochrome c-type biogenesis protein CcsB